MPLRRPGTIARPRLTDLLMAEPRASIVSIVAPPGYGKTTLLADWADLEDRSVAWLTLDEFDNDPSVFLTYVAAALDRIHPIDPSIGAALAAPGTGILAAAVPRLASELHRWERPGLLILDDVHRLVDPACLDALTALLEHLPEEFQVAVAGRTSPDLPVGRFRAHRDLLEIGRDELAFDAEETEALSAEAGYLMTREQARRLAATTEGWAAAIYLASLTRDQSHAVAVGSGDVSGRDGYIAEYLRSELRPVLDDRDVTLLTRTSILEVVEPGLAETVAGLPDAPARLRRLARTNLLIREVTVDGGLYRYHLLLRDYLGADLARREPGSEPELHRRAAAWYSGSGRPELAIEHSIASGDTDATSRLVEAATLRTFLVGHGDRLLRWLRSFDDAAFERRPSLAVDAAYVHALSGHAEAADHMADIVERATFSGATADGSASFESARAMLRAVMIRRGPDDALANAEFAAAAEGPRSPWRTLALEALGSAHVLRGDDRAADEVLADAIDAAPKGGSYGFYALALRASLAMARRDWDAATSQARESHARFERMNNYGAASTLLVHAVAARVAIHRGDLARGREELIHAQLIRPLASYALPAVVVGALLEVARAYLAVADPAGAASAVSDAERIIRRRPDLGVLGTRLTEVRQQIRGSADSLAGPSTFTPAELRVLPMLATQLTFEQIGLRLHVSQHTVKTQSVSIYGKLGVSGRRQAIARAIDIGLLEPFPRLRHDAWTSGD